ncbi:MAG: glycosyltransferase family 9 protein [bacterium]|nr:glycosyltransferase family 9 protein [bacterium]
MTVLQKPKKGARILIVLHGAIGDVVRALPLAVRLKEQRPDIFLAWGVEPRSADILRGHSSIDKLYVFQRGKGVGAYLNYLRELRQGKFDIVLDLQRHIKSGATSFFSAVSRRIGFHPKSSREFNWLFNNEYIPYTEKFSSKLAQYQLFGDLLGLDRDVHLSSGLKVDRSCSERIKNLLVQESNTNCSGLVAVFPGSTWSSRFWLAERHAELSERLYRQHGLVSVYIGGPGERVFIDRVKEVCNVPLIDLVGQTALGELPALFANVILGIGADSGPMHIGAACEVPLVTLWGATSALRSAPLGSEDYTISADVACEPCYRSRCPIRDQICMQSITVDMVYHQVLRVLEKKSFVGRQSVVR